MSTLYYLLEANVYLLVFFAFYKLALQKETFYTGHRIYLIGTTVLAFLMPFVGISGLQEPVQAVQYVAAPPVKAQWDAADTVLLVYGLVAAALLGLFFFKLLRIRQLIRCGRVHTQQGVHIVSNPAVSQSFSFLNYLFLNPAIEKAETVIRHEQAHIRQRHSLDLLFFELVQLACWFNPLPILLKREIRAIHEYIADEEAASYETNAGEYALFLIRNSYNTLPVLGNTMFNQSLLKMRIMKLNQKRSPGAARMKYLPVLLLVPGMLAIAALTSARPYTLVDLMPQKQAQIAQEAAAHVSDTIPAASGRKKVISLTVIEQKPGKSSETVTLQPADKAKSSSKFQIINLKPAEASSRDVQHVRLAEDKSHNLEVVEVRSPEVKTVNLQVIESKQAPPPPAPQEPKKVKKAPAPPKVVERSKPGKLPAPPPPPAEPKAKKGDVPPPPPPVEKPRKGTAPARALPPPPPLPPKKSSGDVLEEVTVTGSALLGKPVPAKSGVPSASGLVEVVVAGKPSPAALPAKTDKKN